MPQLRPLLSENQPLSKEFSDRARPISIRQLLSDFQTIHSARLDLFFQNMALLVAPASYNGTERQKAVDTLIKNLKNERPDVVGLCEVFADGERDYIKSELRHTYPYSAEGPDDELRADIRSDGGLLLLSRYPIRDTHSTVFRDCAGEDCYANKGVIHARINIDLPYHPTEYDIFVTHLQNPNPIAPNLFGTDPQAELEEQLEALGYFLRANSNPLRPAYLLGDLNVDGFDNHLYNVLESALNFDLDLWTHAGDTTVRGLGITSDESGSFQGDRSVRSSDDPSRRQSGKRLDYILCWQGARYLPRFNETETVIWQSSPGRDISDHYGIRAQQSILVERTSPPDITINKLILELAEVYCLTETTGPIPVGSEIVGSDEIQLKMDSGDDRGGGDTKTADVLGGLDSGELGHYNPPLRFQHGDPGGGLDIDIVGSELDTVLGVTHDAADIGRSHLRITREELLWGAKESGKVRRALPVMSGSGAEYIPIIDIYIE